MTEKIDVLDDAGLRTGEILPRREIHRLGKPHRVIHLYLFDASNRLLLQRRSMTVDHYPGALTISVLGHIEAGDTSMATVEREVKEELGLNPSKLVFRFLFSYRRDATLRTDYIDRQFNDVYLARGDFKLADIEVNDAEVAGVQLVELQEFQTMVKTRDSGIADVYRDECHDLVYFLASGRS